MPKNPIKSNTDWTINHVSEVEALFGFLADVQFWIKDAAGRYVRVNAALLRNYGFTSAASVIGHTDAELFPLHLAKQYQLDDQQVLAGTAVHGRVELVGRPDHSTGWHITHKIPLHAADGRIIGTTGITRDLHASDDQSPAVDGLGPVVERIRAHYTEDLAKPLLARLLGTSVRTLERRFMRAFGQSLVTYQRTLRMHQACHLLTTDDESVTSIALSLGYADHSHFTREFRRMFGMPPRLYRQQWQHQYATRLLPTTIASPA